MTPDTIFARASGGGRAAIAVIRLSGPHTRDALLRLTGRLPRPRTATLAGLSDPVSGLLLDRALLLWFPGPASFTGEDTAELQLHGGRAVVAAVLDALSHLDGLRLAAPGEFTRRAFVNGKMDLGEVEGLADLIDAETEAQRRQAVRTLEGALGRWVETLRRRLVGALALTDGAIDFADEDDLVATFRREIGTEVEAVRSLIAAELDVSRRGEKLREGLVVTIAGPPNVGKSTLLNALAGREIAIVSVHAGTTRDAIEVDLDLGGHPLRLIDTAGLRDTDDPVEREGIARARRRAQSSDLVLWLCEPGSPATPPPTEGLCWLVLTKADQAGDRLAGAAGAADHVISARTGAGMDGLVAALHRFADTTLVGAEDAIVTRLRQRLALEAAQSHLSTLLAPDETVPLELLAEDLRATIAALSSLVGEVGTEEILGQIFARFCIGK
ncbi:MAG TPA: tRNA uridine-5-carboxymethylaminomethyl(34) synthesis GTPase MnmE [Lichenihabitans sp.]|nr:tRNA uridine-5-carboxymethylaminomethyl(34) synthesis GTPase MnmE [Lichenihabitans sp.]